MRAARSVARDSSVDRLSVLVPSPRPLSVPGPFMNGSVQCADAGADELLHAQSTDAAAEMLVMGMD